MIERPMLCAKAKTYDQLQFPLLCTPKLDGIRCLKVDGKALSRAFKPIPNAYIREQIESSLPDGVDGELMTYGSYNETQSAVMSEAGAPVFYYAAFDFFHPSLDYWDRIHSGLLRRSWPSWVQLIVPRTCFTLEDFQEFEDECLSAGYEGVVGRSAKGPYKFGRSTLAEHYAVKWKPTEDSEAVILSLEEARVNCNPQVPNAFGYSRRPGGATLKLPKGTLGSMHVKDVYSGVEFDVGTGIGLDDALRAAMWREPHKYVGRIIKYKYQKHGTVDKPRFPSFQGFRDAGDM